MLHPPGDLNRKKPIYVLGDVSKGTVGDKPLHQVQITMPCKPMNWAPPRLQVVYVQIEMWLGKFIIVLHQVANVVEAILEGLFVVWTVPGCIR